MTRPEPSADPAVPARLDRSGVRWLAGIGASVAVAGVALFGAAGRLGWWRGWVFYGFWLLSVLLPVGLTAGFHPDLLNRRGRRYADAKSFDRALLPLIWLCALALPAVAGLDAVRFRWSSMPVTAVAPGAVLQALGLALGTWAIAVNPHFELAVRIQTDVGHRVVTAGPYRAVRHPGYASVLLQMLGAPLVLGSWYAWVPAAGTVLVLVVRTALEDRTLLAELPGYAAYAARTRYRLIPGVW